MLLYRKITLKDKKILLIQKKKAQLSKDEMHGDCGLTQTKNFEKWLDRIKNKDLFIISKQDHSVIGFIHLKFKLTSYDALEGGHIAYTIFQEYRGLGYGTAAFSWGVEQFKIRELFIIILGQRMELL